MDFLTDWLTDWLKELLIGGIMGNLEGLFDYVNTQVGEIAVQVGTTPAAWNAGVFSLIRQLSETVILPIAGLVLTFVATYELIQMLLEKNNMHEFDVANIYKWMFKTACAIFILSNTFDIVMAVFDVSQTVIAQAADPTKVHTLALSGECCPVTEEMFENDALIFDGGQIEEVWLCHKDGTPYVGMKCEGFPDFGIWSVKDAPFVCLEPWMGRCDDIGFDKELSQKPNVNRAAPGESFSKEYEIIAGN